MHNKARRGFFDTPPLRYVGAKWQLAEWIIEQFPPHKSYVEPFCGSAAVFFRKHPSRLEVLNDMDGEIINFFYILRTQRDVLLEQIQLTPFARAEYELALKHCEDPMERARRFYVALWQSFGSTLIYRSGWRTQRSPDMRSPLTSTWKRMDGLMDAADRLKDALIEQRDALECIINYDTPETLFYIDPPYVLSSRSGKGRRRYRVEMNDQQHVALAEVLHSVQGAVLLSGYNNDLYGHLYPDWERLEKTTTTTGNGQAVESLWLSPRCAELKALHKKSEPYTLSLFGENIEGA